MAKGCENVNNRIRAVSNFKAPIPSWSICEMLANVSGVKSVLTENCI